MEDTESLGLGDESLQALRCSELDPMEDTERGKSVSANIDPEKLQRTRSDGGY